MTWGVVLVLLGCGVKYSSTTSRGIACADAADAICDKALSCGYIGSSERAGCISGVTDGCCGDTQSCGDPVSHPDGAAACVNMLPGESCSGIGTADAPNLPAYCRQMF